MTLLDFVRDVVDDWSQGGEAGVAFDEQVDFLREHIDLLYGRYEPPAPAGAEEVRELMLEALDCFTRALDNLELHCDGGEDGLLGQALDLAQEGDDILQSIHYAIEQSQELASVLDE